MKKTEITQEKFNKLLDWLDEDKEIAAGRYYSIHRRLVQIFLARKLFPAEELADRVIDVAIRKIDHLSKEFEGEPAVFFYKVAQNIVWEQIREQKNEELNEEESKKLLQEAPAEIKNENWYVDCLRECLDNFPLEQRNLLIKYFTYSKRTKIKNHKKMSEELGIDINYLRTKIYRLKIKLENCIKDCVKEKKV